MPDGTTAPSRARRAGRPRHPLLTIEGIVDAALQVLARHGTEGLTMSRIAGLLEVTPAALYNHVESKDEILLHVQDRLMDQVDVSGLGREPWPDALRRWARSYRDVMAANPGLIEHIALMPIRGAERTTAMYERLARALAELGWRRRSIVPAIVALESFIFGSALDANSPDDIFELDEDADAPAFAAATAAHFGERAPGEAAEVSFIVGLDALLGSLAERAGVAWPAESPRFIPTSAAEAEELGIPFPGGPATAQRPAG